MTSEIWNEPADVRRETPSALAVRAVTREGLGSVTGAPHLPAGSDRRSPAGTSAPVTCDMRFAARENAILGQPDTGFGAADVNAEVAETVWLDQPGAARC